MKTISDVTEMMLSELSGVIRASENTLSAYKRDLDEFISYCNNYELSDISQINEKHIRRYVMVLNEKKLNKSSVSRKLSSLRRLFNYAIRFDILEQNPLRKIPNPKVKRKLPETINLDSFLEIYRLIDEDIENDDKLRDKAILELLYGCALRISELCGLNIGDIDLEKMNVRVLGKGSKVRIVPLGNKSLNIIKDYFHTLNTTSNSQPLFVKKGFERLDRITAYKVVKKYLNKVTDIKKKSPHILRHSAATHMLDRDADIMAVKEILGHENLSTTQIYTHVSIERLKKSYKKAHPKS